MRDAHRQLTVRVRALDTDTVSVACGLEVPALRRVFRRLLVIRGCFANHAGAVVEEAIHLWCDAMRRWRHR